MSCAGWLVRRLACAGALAVLCVCSVGARAAVGSNTTLLLVRAGNADSETVAAEYARLRHIKPVNIVRLADVPDAPVIPVAAFRDRILTPAFAAMRERRLTAKITAIVYSCGFPYAVDVSADMAGKSFPRVITQPASITGATYFAEDVLRSSTDYLALDANPYYLGPARSRPVARMTEADKARQAELGKLLQEYQEARGSKEIERAAAALRAAQKASQELVTAHPDSPDLLYDHACIASLQERLDEAIALLKRAMAAGWANAPLTLGDPDFTALRGRDDFKALIDEMRRTAAVPQKPVPFPGTFAGGRRLYLSAMLGYIGPAANTVDEVLACLKRSVQADGARPKGSVYYMVSSDWARTGPRQWAFAPAAAALEKLGVHAEVADGVLPDTKPHVAGAMVGAAGFTWADSGSAILPGAFCDHLTSFGGLMTGAGQTLLSEFIRAGAAGACGTVAEPYNTPAKFPSPFLHVYYAGGMTLVEAFYQSVSGPYQQLLVGDPLCRPWPAQRKSSPVKPARRPSRAR